MEERTQPSHMDARSDLYKQAKESFVSGLGGTSLGEISLLTVALAAGYLLKCTATVCLPAVNSLKKSSVT